MKDQSEPSFLETDEPSSSGSKSALTRQRYIGAGSAPRDPARVGRGRRAFARILATG